jgi:hypothetical protein
MRNLTGEGAEMDATKLTAAELSERPDNHRPTLAQFHKLPQGIRDELRLFEVKIGVFEVPAYRYRVWLSALKAIRQKEE